MKRIFFWLPQGRLGNLIFQHQAIRHLSAGGWVIALDSEFFDLFEKSPRFIVVPCPKMIRRYVAHMWVALLRWCARQNWIGLVQTERLVVFESFTSESHIIQWRTGKLGRVFLVTGFFQTPNFMHPLPQLKQTYFNGAEQQLALVPKHKRVAIHIRFGDFLDWPVFGIPGAACLPVTYYANAMRLIESEINAPHYLVFSDDPGRALILLGETDKPQNFAVIQSSSSAQDFAIIAACSHAIISASTFSWWTATLITYPDKILIAPEFWLGFQKNIWYPPGIRGDQFTYILPDAQNETTPYQA